MKITKRQLRRIIKEENEKLLVERGTGNPGLRAEERTLMNAAMAFQEKYMLTMGMDPSNPTDLRRVRGQIDDIIASVLGD